MRSARLVRAGLRPGVLRAGRWTAQALRALRPELAAHGLEASRPVAPSRPLPRSTLWVVRTVLRRQHATCLERCLVLQTWWLGQGRAHDVIVGVRHADGFDAHAWLADLEHPDLEYTEISRLPAS